MSPANSGTLGPMSPEKTKTNPLGAGRNPRAGEASINVTIRLAPTERDAYRHAAERAGITLSDWIRETCNRASSRTAPKRKRR